MAKTLLDCINETMRRAGFISGDAAAFTTLTDSARQRAIDIAVQVANEGIEELYSSSNVPLPSEQAESTITLVTSTRAYSLASDLVQFRFPLVDKTNSQHIYEYPGGYNQMLIDDPEQDDTGLPHFAAIRPTDGLLHMDRAPTSDDNGNSYTYQYDKDISMSVTTDTVPFGDAVFRAMVPAWVQLWKRDMRNEFDGDLFLASIGRASRLVSQKQTRTTWNPR